MSSSAPSKVGHAIIRASVLVAVGHLVFKFAGLIQAMVMGRVLPKETYDIVYGFAFENCIFTLFLVGEEVIGPALMPLFMRELDSKGGERSAWSFAKAVLWIQSGILLAVVALLLAEPEGFVRLFTRWTSARTPEAFDQAVSSVRWLAPSLLGLSLASTTYVLLNGYKRFFLASFADAVWKLVVAALLVLGVFWSPTGLQRYLVAGLLIGSWLKLGTHLLGLRDKASFLRVRADFRHPSLGPLLRLMLPLMAGVLFAKWRDVFNNVHVLSGLSETGLIQANSMGRKLSSAIAMLVPYTLSIAIFPFLCEMVDRSAREELGALITRSGRMLISLLLPLSAVLAVVALPLTGLLYGGGLFDDTAVSRTAVAMVGYTFVLPALAVEMLLMQAFFAHRRTYSVTVVGMLFSTFSIAISYATVVRLGWQGAMALAGIAGGLTLSRWLKTVTLVFLLRRNAPVFPVRPTLGFLVRAGLVSVGCAAAARGGVLAARTLGSGLLVGRPGLVLQLAGAGTLACVAFVAGCALFGVREPLAMVSWTVARIRGRKVAADDAADGPGT